MSHEVQVVAAPTSEAESGRLEMRRSLARMPAILKHVILLAFALVMIYPLLWMLMSSFTPNEQMFSTMGLLHRTWTLENYIHGWTALSVPFGRFMWNSAVVSLLSIIGNLVSCSLAAYAFARLQFRGRGVLFATMLATIMLPFHVVIVPQYILFNALGWVNTFLPLVLPKFLAVDSFFVFLMVQFMRGIPRDLDEAATIDGCGPLRTFVSVILPLCLPAISVTALFTFIWTWNDFFVPLLYLSTPDMYTAPVGLNSFQTSETLSDYGALFAMSVVSLVPVFVVFLAAQKTLTKGIATTGLK